MYAFFEHKTASGGHTYFAIHADTSPIIVTVAIRGNIDSKVCLPKLSLYDYFTRNLDMQHYNFIAETILYLACVPCENACLWTMQQYPMFS